MSETATRIKTSSRSETWRVVLDSGRWRHVRISYDDDLDAVVVATADHKDPWVSDGMRYDSFETARAAHGLDLDAP